MNPRYIVMPCKRFTSSFATRSFDTLMNALKWAESITNKYRNEVAIIEKEYNSMFTTIGTAVNGKISYY